MTDYTQSVRVNNQDFTINACDCHQTNLRGQIQCRDRCVLGGVSVLVGIVPDFMKFKGVIDFYLTAEGSHY